MSRPSFLIIKSCHTTISYDCLNYTPIPNIHKHPNILILFCRIFLATFLGLRTASFWWWKKAKPSAGIISRRRARGLQRLRKLRWAQSSLHRPSKPLTSCLLPGRGRFPDGRRRDPMPASKVHVILRSINIRWRPTVCVASNEWTYWSISKSYRR